jgi:hypothetical protein
MRFAQVFDNASYKRGFGYRLKDFELFRTDCQP